MTESQKARRRTSYKNNRKKVIILNFHKFGEYTCEYCSRAPLYKNGPDESKMRPDLLTVDHKIPLSKGGLNILDNLTVCCQECNNLKADNV